MVIEENLLYNQHINIGTMKLHTDRISTLPDELLCHIISYLPLKDAIRTSTLSSRWTDIMAFVPVLDFEHPAPSLKFINIADKLLSNKRSANLQKLRLQVDRFDWSILVFCVNDWVRSAIDCNVVDLDVRVPDFDSNIIENGEEFGLHIIASDTLQTLKVSGGLGLHMPSSTGCFKNLKTFEVKLNDPDKELLEKLFCSLPQLEKLLFEGKFSKLMKMDMNICINIIVPALKQLSLKINQEDFHNADFEVMIDAPVLENIFLEDEYLATYSIKHPTSLVKATLDVGRDYDLDDYYMDDARLFRVNELFYSLSYVKSLSVLNGAAAALNWCAEGVPLLHELTHLYLDDLCLTGLSLLPVFFASAPNLKTAVITVQKQFNNTEGWTWYTTPTTRVSHLEEFEIRRAKLIRDKLNLKEMVRYIVMNAEVLKKLTVDGKRLAGALLQYIRSSLADRDGKNYKMVERFVGNEER